MATEQTSNPAENPQDAGNLRKRKVMLLALSVIVILGGLGSIPGATLGGFILAFMEELGAGYISSGFRDGMGFLLIILILLIKPAGLFAQKERIG